MRDVGFTAMKIGLNDRANGGIPRANALNEVDGSLRVERPFHVDAQKIIEARGTLHDGAKQALAKFHVDIEAELSELAGNVGVQSFLSDAFKNLDIGIAGMLRIRNGGNIFAEIIEAGEHARIIAFARGGDGFIQSLTGDEPARHAPRSAIGSDPIGEAFVFGKLEQRRPEHARLIMAAWKD